MKRNKYGAIEMENLDKNISTKLFEVLTQLQLIGEIRRSDSEEEVWKIKPDCNFWFRSGWIVQKYHFYDYILDENGVVKKVLIMDHYYDGSSSNSRRHVHLKNYLTFSKVNEEWSCVRWQGAQASAITRMSKTLNADKEGYLIQLVEFKSVNKILLSI